MHTIIHNGESCSCGQDTCLCQKCGQVVCGTKAVWQEVPESNPTREGQVCDDCRPIRIPNTSQVARYLEFVAGLKETPPVKTGFVVGQVVAYVNDYGVIFDDMTIIGFAEDDSFYGKFIHLNTDCYWCAVAPGSLRVVNENGKYEIREGEVVYEHPVF